MSIIKSKDVIEVNQITKDLEKVRNEIDKLTVSNKKLSESLQRVKKSNNGTEAKELIKLTKQLETSTNKLNVSKGKEATTLAAVKVEQQRVNKENKEAATLANKNISLYQKESIKLNNLRKSYKDLAIQNKENTKEGKKLLDNLTKLDKKLKDVDNAVGQNQRSVGKYSNALKGIGKQLLGAAGITAGLTLMIDQFKKASERIGILNNLTRQLKGTFDITTKEAKKLASQINAMATNFEDVDAKALQTSLTSIVKTFDDLSEQEALDLIQEGFQKGSNNSGEFLDILKEYPVQFKAAGIDAKTMFAIINQQVKQGIYSDKGVDAIKEGGLRLRENTKAVQDALRPFDEYTKQQIKLAIESGNSFEAIQLVSKGLTDTKLTASQTQAVIADVFGGAGEDAGIEYIKTLQDVQTNLDDVAKQTSIVSDANLKLSESYNNFLTSVSDGSGIISEAIAGLTNMGSEFLETARIFNETNLSNKLKILANAALSLMEKAFVPFISVLKALGVEIPEFRFEIENTSETLRKLKLEQAEVIDKSNILVRLTKEQKEALKEETKEVVKLTDAQKKLIVQRKEDSKIFESRKGDVIESLENEIEIVKSVGEVRIETEQEIQDNLTSIVQDATDNRGRIRLEKATEIAEAEALILEQLQTSAVQLATDIFNSFQDEKLAKINSDAEAQKAILQQRLDDGVISEEEFANQIAAIEKKQRIESAKAEKKKALFDIAIATAIAAAKAGFITPAAIAILAAGAIQAAFIAAKPLPTFAEGTEYVNGEGTSKSDSIHAKLSVGERVVPAEINQMLNGIPNSELPGLINNQDNNMMLAGLLMNMNDTNKQILQAALNTGVFYTMNGQGYLRGGNGKIKNFIP